MSAAESGRESTALEVIAGHDLTGKETIEANAGVMATPLLRTSSCSSASTTSVTSRSPSGCCCRCARAGVPVPPTS